MHSLPPTPTGELNLRLVTIAYGITLATVLAERRIGGHPLLIFHDRDPLIVDT
jgi:hypothetical protein